MASHFNVHYWVEPECDDPNSGHSPCTTGEHTKLFLDLCDAAIHGTRVTSSTFLTEQRARTAWDNHRLMDALITRHGRPWGVTFKFALFNSCFVPNDKPGVKALVQLDFGGPTEAANKVVVGFVRSIVYEGEGGCRWGVLRQGRPLSSGRVRLRAPSPG